MEACKLNNFCSDARTKALLIPSTLKFDNSLPVKWCLYPPPDLEGSRYTWSESEGLYSLTPLGRKIADQGGSRYGQQCKGRYVQELDYEPFERWRTVVHTNITKSSSIDTRYSNRMDTRSVMRHQRSLFSTTTSASTYPTYRIDWWSNKIDSKDIYEGRKLFIVRMAWPSAGSPTYPDDISGLEDLADTRYRACTTSSASFTQMDSVVAQAFWKRVAELTTRYRDSDNNWVAAEETRIRHAVNAQTQDRVGYYESREPLQMKRLKQLENVIRQGHKSAEGVDKHEHDLRDSKTSNGCGSVHSLKQDLKSRVHELGERLEILETQLQESRVREAAAVQRELAERVQHDAALRITDSFIGNLYTHVTNTTTIAKQFETQMETVKSVCERVGPTASAALLLAVRLSQETSNIGRRIPVASQHVIA
ncbi:hypothetical protein C8F04DRAFT_1176069 [Mycena alexandri]|uniref:Uncharacterized protein n=1 Tax=Mycena alexandri TaxID=1745969 RepID=A0AAD6TCR2_9AGAR|nr:hypothetical protein C8F04DRAFT_1176069 [Mycena alexandri]